MATPPVSTMMQLFPSFVVGNRLLDGGDVLALATILFSPNVGVVALAGGGQTGATVLLNGFNEVKTVASGGDSVALPMAIPGAFCAVYNKGAQSMQVYGQPANPANPSTASPQGQSDVVTAHNSNNAAAAGAGVAHPSAVGAFYYCFDLGTWKQFVLGT